MLRIRKTSKEIEMPEYVHVIYIYDIVTSDQITLPSYDAISRLLFSVV